ncbi:MAG: hypothetical protein DCF20_19875 [Pseudanabaena sp.]|nr:MAG: hypothetical protein DCF20_19875 [Pseudanabaena sp.]
MITILLRQLPNIEKLLIDTTTELEYYAAYDPDVINVAISMFLVKSIEIGMTSLIKSRQKSDHCPF